MPEPHTKIVTDPRRPGRAMFAVRCWCGRFYTMTYEEAVRRQSEGKYLCPDECGRGAE